MSSFPCFSVFDLPKPRSVTIHVHKKQKGRGISPVTLMRLLYEERPIGTLLAFRLYDIALLLTFKIGPWNTLDDWTAVEDVEFFDNDNN